eukprot:scaffold7921_cov109-Isochrysis_galbana.AAC.2
MMRSTSHSARPFSAGSHGCEMAERISAAIVAGSECSSPAISSGRAGRPPSTAPSKLLPAL